MFGYIRADFTKLSEEKQNEYRTVYCTLCNSLKKNFGIFSRYLLNYDVTFLALVLLDDKKSASEACLKYCPYKAKKCEILTSDTKIFLYCACVIIILAYEKLLDNIRDEIRIKKLFYLLLAQLLKRKYLKAKALYPDLCDKIRENMIKQEKIEKAQSSLDRAAHSSADSLGLIFQAGSDNPAAYRFGYALGRWIYFTDAADDIQKDQKKDSFNPFLVNQSSKQKIEEVLNLSISEACASYEAMKGTRYHEIIENILFEGSENSQQRVLEGKTQ